MTEQRDTSRCFADGDAVRLRVTRADGGEITVGDMGEVMARLTLGDEITAAQSTLFARIASAYGVDIVDDEILVVTTQASSDTAVELVADACVALDVVRYLN